MDYQKPTTIEQHKTYSVFEASKYMDCSDECVRLKIKKGKLKAARVDNGPWQISGDSLIKIMAQVIDLQQPVLRTKSQYLNDARQAKLAIL